MATWEGCAGRIIWSFDWRRREGYLERKKEINLAVKNK